MTPGLAGCGLLLGCAVLAAWPSSPVVGRLQAQTACVRGPGRHQAMSPDGLPAVAASVLAGIVLALAVGGAQGVLLGCGVALLALRWLRGLEAAEPRRRRQQVTRDLPWAADLLAVAVEGGAPLDRAVRCTGEAVGGPIGEELRGVAAALELGAPPSVAWSGIDTALAGVGQVVHSGGSARHARRAVRRPPRRGAALGCACRLCRSRTHRRCSGARAPRRLLPAGVPAAGRAPSGRRRRVDVAALNGCAVHSGPGRWSRPQMRGGAPGATGFRPRLS